MGSKIIIDNESLNKILTPIVDNSSFMKVKPKFLKSTTPDITYNNNIRTIDHNRECYMAFVAGGDGVQKSTDNGKTWYTLNAYMIIDDTSNPGSTKKAYFKDTKCYATSLIWCSKNNCWYAAIAPDANIHYNNYTGGLWKSTDGVEWNRVNDDGLFTINVVGSTTHKYQIQKLVLHDTGLFICVGAYGLYKYDYSEAPTAESFTFYGFNKQVGSKNYIAEKEYGKGAYSFCIENGNYIVGAFTSMGIYVSTDNGETFTQAENSIITNHYIGALETNGNSMIVAASGTTTVIDYMLYSMDHGLTWSKTYLNGYYLNQVYSIKYSNKIWITGCARGTGVSNPCGLLYSTNGIVWKVCEYNTVINGSIDCNGISFVSGESDNGRNPTEISYWEPIEIYNQYINDKVTEYYNKICSIDFLASDATNTDIINKINEILTTLRNIL